MLSRNELIEIYNSLNDGELKIKIGEKLFINDEVIKDIFESFKGFDIAIIHKSNYENMYTINVIDPENEYTMDLIKVSLKLGKKYKKYDLKINTHTHEDINDVWFNNEILIYDKYNLSKQEPYIKEK